MSYLLGSIPSAYIVGRLTRGIDIRKLGSRNIGGMDTVTVVGLLPGIVVILVE